MSAPQKSAAPAIAIEQPYSRIFINSGDALDHAIMRTRQLVVAVNLVDEESRNGGAA